MPSPNKLQSDRVHITVMKISDALQKAKNLYHGN
jgi:hypothetical protein